MKHITLRILAPLMAMALITGCVDMKLGADKTRVLTAPPAPFAAQKVLKAMPVLKERDTMRPSPGGTSYMASRQYGVYCGDNALLLDGPLNLQLTLGGQPRPTASIGYWGSTAQGSGHPFQGEEPTLLCDQAAKTITATKRFNAASKTELDGVFTERIKLLDDGLIDVNYSYQVPKDAKVTDQGLFLWFRPFGIVEGMKLIIDGKTYAFSGAAAPFGDRAVFSGEAASVVFAPDKPEKSFQIIFPQKTFFEIREFRQEANKGNQWKFNANLRANPDKNGNISFQLDMRSTSAESLKESDSFAGINFWKDDRLHVPDFAASRNLLQNSSFESDLRYYANGVMLWGTWPGADRKVYEIDDKTAKFGRRSLRATTWKDYPGPTSLSTFTIPTIPGKKYTFSFFAKSDSPKQWIDVGCVSGEWLKFPALPGFGPGVEWKRYSGTFTAPNNAAILVFRPRNNGGPEIAHVWMDGLQVEEGEKASDYVEPQVDTMLFSSSPDNFLQPGKEIAARLRISTAFPDSQISVVCSIEDYFYQEPWKDSFNVRTDAKGEAIINLPLDGKLGSGIFVLRVDCAPANGVMKTDFHRISIMEPLKGDFKHRQILSVPGFGGGCSMEAYVRLLGELGIGSTSYDAGEDNVRLGRKYGIIDSGCTVLSYYSAAKSGDLRKVKDSLAMRAKTEPYNDKLRDDIESFSYELVKACPWIDNWSLYHESGGGAFKVLAERDYDGFAKLLIATYKGVKRADPAKIAFLDGGPCNMMPDGGIRDIDLWLNSANKLAPDVRFDAFAIHPYRQTPESPDLDADAAALFKVLEKHGYLTAPVYWNEGIYYTPWNIPEWGLIPYQGCSMDHWSAGTPTYHMGWGERISSAYTARSWLVALKYGDRVRQFTAWGLRLMIDSYLAPSMAVAKIPNTLGRLLGNSTFKKDIRFAVNCRAYVFDDGTGRPVAALWSYFPMVDRGFEPSPVAKINFAGMKPEFIDLMENQVFVARDSKGIAEVPVTPFPLFIRGRKGELDALCLALGEVVLTGSTEFALAVDMKLKSRNAASISFCNQISRNFQGTASIGVGDSRQERKLELAENASSVVDIALPEPVPQDEIGRITIPVEVRENGGDTIKKEFSLRAFSVARRKAQIEFDGKFEAWKEIPAIKLDNRRIYKTKLGTSSVPVNYKTGYPGDIEAETRMAWDKDFLYLYVKVVDDKPFFPKGSAGPGGDWSYDSLQIYIDTLGDNARRKNKAIFDSNDYNYDVSMTAETGKVNVYRRVAPEQQLAGGLDAPKPDTVEPDVKAKITLTADGYVYEIAFPRRLIAPLKLEENSFFRIGLMVNDNDGEGRKGGLVNTETPDSEPYSNPEQWAGVLLVD